MTHNKFLTFWSLEDNDPISAKSTAQILSLTLVALTFKAGVQDMVYKFFNMKKGSGVRATSKVGVNVNEELALEFHKPVIKKFK